MTIRKYVLQLGFRLALGGIIGLPVIALAQSASESNINAVNVSNGDNATPNLPGPDCHCTSDGGPLVRANGKKGALKLNPDGTPSDSSK